MPERIPFKELAQFLVKAKKQGYAADATYEPDPNRPGFKTWKFKDGLWAYIDSYKDPGFFSFSGGEIVRFDGIPFWMMSYAGDIMPGFCSTEIAKNTYAFLQQALGEIPTDAPFRGPQLFQEGDFVYINNWQGTVSAFKGSETIYYAPERNPAESEKMFECCYMGTLFLEEGGEVIPVNPLHDDRL